MAKAALKAPEPNDAALYERIEKTLRLKSIHSASDLARLVEQRLSTRVVTALVDHGLTETEVFRLVIPRRTFSHRQAKQEALTREESDRVVRIARLVALAEQVFGSRDKALRWLRKPKRRFDARTPLDLLATEASARLVEEMLYQIDEGMVT